MSLNSTERFTSRVADYVRYRPDYPVALVEWLHRELGVDRDTPVADIGAGTGISCKLFLDGGHPVTAVEPNASMRAASIDWLGGNPGFSAVAGTAEATTLADASVGLVAAAQAFHWFDQQAVRTEWARILKPGGLAVVFWNSRRLSGTPFLEGYEQMLLDYGLDYTSVAERYNDDASMEAWFGGGLRGTARFDHGQQLDLEALRGRLLSSSYAPQAGHPQHAPMLEALRKLFDATARDGTVSFDYDTRVFAGTLPATAS
ncbi:class I SAM-dependent methyltransferase [Pseudoxanthomonas composti]|uniref:Class I SAM-dependent methyltransferase n=1 Tax=Pseudoxanthomonas composti TaxID=2137479 RepID=A0A4Q1JY51_9GAMM|nr:class I SAM-dependent methyltransferase [Pseudoxanthomonas composti]RXR07063.1 class I SAM-dependent methyltransferase [Pseudoxanthomonas composti]